MATLTQLPSLPVVSLASGVGTVRAVQHPALAELRGRRDPAGDQQGAVLRDCVCCYYIMVYVCLPSSVFRFCPSSAIETEIMI